MGDPVVLFFLLGLAARLLRSELRLPEGLYDILAFYLLLAIGLKGGVELSRQPLADIGTQVAACVGLGLAIPFALVPVLRALGFSRADSASLAGHYGSVSVVTFALAAAYLQRQAVPVEAHAALWVALMEAPGLVAAILLARWPGAGNQTTPWRQLGHDVFLGRSVLLLVGGIAIGVGLGEAGMAPLQAVFVEPFKGVLALFLLELGLVVGSRLPAVRTFGWRLLGFAVIAPLALAVAGALVGVAVGLSTGGVALMATLAASASYIAAPTAMRIAVPEADPALSITAALAVTFPFNLLLGIPLYLQLARALSP
ncbi:sodium-dependent bicarbonate transport family permease [Ramlibacter tataouinensis]|uniref:Candidate integral membrane protein n=1 Tax=Ramlibacter tataouinensis (strain ATCC BAA-407 / DSM 14655 / LMG 21543 / TTB310) TaxID=365046 RepID=F5XYK2_RAMTT|nr:sodium-dependent bicarbonate transport family permease [Ramlibacter tataouinensis]AEG93178.1 Candidate integral membrane protein [Ramlibacter tataouinensis TTB310]